MRMPGGRGTPRHTLRLDDRIWDLFGEATPDRAGVLREFIDWYVGVPGAELPVRPIDRRPGPAQGRRAID